ncbi:beta-ketoacyl-ACP reductase [Alicyclobacillus acidoterrestris]|uniref:SDR family NAD(P)-dependent oxidoreductase n=1 Tax=Alicyclobacillus suci TaxID=2816080 RepID=UPI00118F7D80|nr:SDR family NAD(P)-dependent oxidoreductase [Alicyclobacillus suci]GEO26442.1 beta-ketoacyl-ACP reductase [Alicyclobacillus acidoterrestris]
MSYLQGQIAVVTGSGSGIGKAVAEALCQQGAHVCIVDLDATRAAEVVEQFKAKGLRAADYALDVSNSRRVSEFFTSVEETYGKLDILVNCAGYAATSLLDEMDDEAWTRMLSVHADGSFYCLREAAKIMKKHHYGRVVNISSLAAESGMYGHVHYTAAKYAIVGLTEVAAKELGPFHITVNAIKPGIIRTPLGEQGLLANGVGERFERVTPIQRIGEPKDIARTAAFLVHPESDFITGTSIVVDGGFILMNEMDTVVCESLRQV